MTQNDQNDVKMSSKCNLSFSKGGWQTAASDQGGAFDYFLEGQLELLDEPGEWLHDDEAGLLYLLPNTTDGAPGGDGGPAARRLGGSAPWA